MSQQHINYGSSPNDGTGDTLRVSQIKAESNFTELYNNKVDKVDGKGLSDTNFTQAEKDKLADLVEGGQVQSDMAVEDIDDPAYIKNKFTKTSDFFNDGDGISPFLTENTNAFPTKLESQTYTYTGTDSEIIIPINATRIDVTEAVLIEKITYLDTTLVYEGRSLFISNRRNDEGDIALSDVEGSGTFETFLIDKIEFVEIIEFKYQSGRWQFVGDLRNQISDIDGLEEALAQIPVNYSKIVYVNDTTPTTATIFDLNNPPTTNDNALKIDVNNLYVGTDASTWVYQTSPAGYVTKSVATPPAIQIEVGSSQNVQTVWNGATIIFTANCTITVPASLPANFIFNGITLAGVTVAWAITAPKTWLFGTPASTTEKQIFTFTQRGSTNSILLLGV